MRSRFEGRKGGSGNHSEADQSLASAGPGGSGPGQGGSRSSNGRELILTPHSEAERQGVLMKPADAGGETLTD